MKTTLNTDLIEPYRRSGNTTRQVDYAIQLLFQGEDVEVRDHHEGGTHRGANEYLFDKIEQRLMLEHGSLFKFDKQNLTITWRQ